IAPRAECGGGAGGAGAPCGRGGCGGDCIGASGLPARALRRRGPGATRVRRAGEGPDGPGAAGGWRMTAMVLLLCALGADVYGDFHARGNGAYDVGDYPTAIAAYEHLAASGVWE